MQQARHFAAALGVSKRTLEQWEQGRRQPSGAAKTLLLIAERHPEVLIETWITRVMRGGQTLSDAEHHLLCLLIAELPPHLRDAVERQFESYNLAQREIDGRALNFYRVRLGTSGVLPVTPLLNSKLEVAPLVRVSAKVAGEIEPLHAVLTAVNGRAFSVSFSRAVSANATAEALSVDKVTQAWKANFDGDQSAA